VGPLVVEARNILQPLSGEVPGEELVGPLARREKFNDLFMKGGMCLSSGNFSLKSEKWSADPVVKAILPER